MVAQTQKKFTMKQYHIFHAISPLRFTETEVQPRVYAGFVYASSIDDAFFKSNNFDDAPWNEENPCRSTSVGDIIQDNDKFFMVCGIGFKELIQEEDAATLADQQEENKYLQ